MIVDRYLVRSFFPVFLVAMSMFVTIVVLIDLFVNLVNYLNYNATFKDIMLCSLYYVPKSIEYATPVALLFAVAYSLGDLYARNELISLITSGIPFWRLGYSLLFIGVLFSVLSFYFDDRVVIPTLKIKNEMTRRMKHQSNTDENVNVVIKVNDGRRIYAVDYFDYERLSLTGVIIVNKDAAGNFESEIRSPQATWNGTCWQFSNAVVYAMKDDKPTVTPLAPTTDYTDSPELFRRSSVNPADLSARDAAALVSDLQSVGLPYMAAQTEYYHRYSFPATSFIVIILSLSLAGRFRKNILLMSLLTSLSIAVGYYIIDMITMMMARLGQIPSVVGAWFPVIFFTVVGVLMLRFSKT